MQRATLGFTPTGVGKSRTRAAGRPRRSVHPHGRGEKASLIRSASARAGSPPRAWGKARRRGDQRPRRGFTPTGVGKSRKKFLKSRGGLVHPHGRGEKSWARSTSSRPRGSPPRAWGKARWRSCSGGSPRFTPTGVGKRGWQRKPCPGGQVHPHGRGEKDTRHGRTIFYMGSPPRAWGKDQGCGSGFSQPRFTPTGVGKRSPAQSDLRDGTVHPHGRGEKPGRFGVGEIDDGSPPRAWGKGRRVEQNWVVAGFTPTGVGKRAVDPPDPSPSPVHPHGRGEKPGAAATRTARGGSPPRAWGKG